MATNSDEYAGRAHEAPVQAVLTAERDEYESATPHLTEAEQQLLASWNDATRQDYPRNVCVPELVARQASAAPDAVALVVGNEVLSYRELNRRANQLAHYLQRLGVGPGVLVSLCVERSVDMVVGLLGILKAGGAYVPIDPVYPTERITYMLEDSQSPVLVTHQYLAARLPLSKTQIVCLDAEAPLLLQQNASDPDTLVTADDLAYVIYTSGSTGRPKGALITHDGLLNLVYWHQRAFTVTSADRATQVASPAFDATGWELWPYLTIGASVYLPDEDTRITPRVLRDWLVNNGITITFLPTALAESIMALDWPATTALRFLLTGADKLEHYPPASLPFVLINNYGLTEATVVNTSGRIAPIGHPGTPPSIGRPIANTQIYILDEHLQQVSIGETGELYIGGKGLGKGYLNRAELTAERFIPDPFSEEPGARLYKTGDLAYFLPDGQIAFLGRADHQIKIRGYRIEPSEIVAVLNSHPAIKTSLIAAREDTPGNKRLVAYIVPASRAQLTLDSVRDTLAAQLPEYMIPAAFVVLEAMPLTANGKVDRAALPAPDATNILRDDAAAAPSSPLEERLAQIVSTLLNVDTIGREDNFFMLGGHSLLGTQLIARIAEAFGVTLTLRVLFQAPTIRQLSDEIERLILAKLEMMSDEEAQQLLEQVQMR